jgi:2-polyprenyl-6-hydroxyphenyl methylase/3-demethylubiquinone-9 3-methyltransferase
MLLKEIDRRKIETILEMGCGNSIWLPYLARKRNVKVFGIDYSEEGCALARKRLETENVAGKIICQDVFTADHREIGQFDLVYSLGVIEHYTNTEEILRKLMDFVKPGGTLLTEIPNLGSIHGFLAKIYQPSLLAKHKILSRKDLQRYCVKIGMENVYSCYIGVFSLNIVAWGTYPLFPGISPKIVSFVRRINPYLDFLLKKIGTFKGIRPVAPFLYVVGEKPTR